VGVNEGIGRVGKTLEKLAGGGRELPLWVRKSRKDWLDNEVKGQLNGYWEGTEGRLGWVYSRATGICD